MPTATCICPAQHLAKKDKATLNLRPPTNQGLLIEVYHPAFASFLHDVRSSMPPDIWTLESNVNQVSLAVCSTMVYEFENENIRRTWLMVQPHKFDIELQVEFYIPPTLPLETHISQLDLRLSAEETTILLGEVKGEFETGSMYASLALVPGTDTPSGELGEGIRWISVHALGGLWSVDHASINHSKPLST